MVNRLKYLVGGIVYIIFTIPLFLVAIVADAFNSYSLSNWVRKCVNWLSDSLLSEAEEILPLPSEMISKRPKIPENEDATATTDDDTTISGAQEYRQVQTTWYKEALGYVLMIPLTIITMLLFLLGGFLKFQPLIACGFSLGRFLMDLFGIEDDFVYEKYEHVNELRNETNIDAKTK